MLAGVNAFSLFSRAMVHPDDDVLRRIAFGAHGERRAVFIQNHQRAGGVETDPRHAFRRRAGLPERFPDAVTNGLPDLLAGLLHAAAAPMSGRDFLRDMREQRAAQVEDTCADAA